MEVYINGEPRRVSEDTSVARLIQLLDLSGRRIAVEINQEIVPRERYTSRRLQGGDRIEIVHAIGGG